MSSVAAREEALHRCLHLSTSTERRLRQLPQLTSELTTTILRTHPHIPRHQPTQKEKKKSIPPSEAEIQIMASPIHCIHSKSQKELRAYIKWKNPQKRSDPEHRQGPCRRAHMNLSPNDDDNRKVYLPRKFPFIFLRPTAHDAQISAKLKHDVLK